MNKKLVYVQLIVIIFFFIRAMNGVISKQDPKALFIAGVILMPILFVIRLVGLFRT